MEKKIMTKCNKCGSTIINNACLCSHAPDTTTKNKPATEDLISALQKAVAKSLCRKPNPAAMPKSIADVALWLLRLFEQEAKGEQPYQVSARKKGSASAWVWPYFDRVSRLSASFLSLNESFQKIIISARKDKIAWRGEPEEQFLEIVSEVRRRASIGSEKYKQEARKKLRTVLS